ncbi:MAG: hypothetical protein V3R27_06905, partial [Pseudomonadales bacterium]
QTEIYIPIGKSPGLSGIHTGIGQIQGFDAASRTLSLAAQGGTRPVRITGDTNIWLDRSKAKLRNKVGGVSEFVSGRRAEVKYLDPAKRQSAAWVKVEVGN